MDDLTLWIRKNQRLVIVAGLLVIALVVVVLANVSHHENNKVPQTKQGQVSQAEVKLLKDTLDIYYLNHQAYPVNLATLRDDIKTDPNSSYKMTIDDYDRDIKDIPHLSYSVRGDESSYKITYTDENETMQTVQGNYEKDYH